ncbi:MAG TPA: hypothetical protein PKD53_12230 [Chloroflexaceae bacterium]|nr:hypothetical protein [Chloroflexaceae bacterium]
MTRILNPRTVAALIAAVVVAVVVATVTPALAAPKSRYTSELIAFDPFPNPGPVVEGARAELRTNHNSAELRLDTAELTPGDAVTVWWVIFNNPEACANYASGGICTLDDLFGNTAAVGGEVTYATGKVIGADGTASFKAKLRTGEVKKGWFGNGFVNPRGAEIHAIVHTHGPVIPGQEKDMTTTFRGGCADDAMINPSFPPNAYNDGTPGPNQCQDLQVAIFMQK